MFNVLSAINQVSLSSYSMQGPTNPSALKHSIRQQNQRVRLGLHDEIKRKGNDLISCGTPTRGLQFFEYTNYDYRYNVIL